MNDPKSFASLSPTLLARKGAAKPAMRPQLQPLQQFHEATARQIEDDLGWNDMGHDHDDVIADASADIVATDIAPAGEVVAFSDHFPPVGSDPIFAQVPEVVRQQEGIVERIIKPAVLDRPVFSARPAAKAKAANSARSRRSALADGRRAAFTLRLDAERHLKLRLACTINNRSAQQMVIEALDRLIDELPDVASLAAQVSQRRTSSEQGD